MKRVLFILLMILFLVPISTANTVQLNLKAGLTLAFDNKEPYVGLSLDFIRIAKYVFVGVDVMVGKSRTHYWKEDASPWFKKRYKDYKCGFVGVSVKGIFFEYFAFPILGYNTDDNLYIGLGIRF